jgi:hypothetical protein
MGVDLKNSARVDLEDIFVKIKERSLRICVSNGLDVDKYSIMDHEIPRYIMDFFQDGAAQISEDAGLTKHYLQTGVDAITFYSSLEAGLDYGDADGLADYTDQNTSITASAAATTFYTYTITDTNNIFTTNQTLSSLNNSHANLSTGDITVLSGQTTASENGTYRVEKVGSPTKLSDLFEIIQVMTFATTMPAYTLGELVSDGTNQAQVIGLDSDNLKVVTAKHSVGYFSGTATLTGSTSTTAVAAASETKHVLDAPVIMDIFDVVKGSGPKTAGEKLDVSSAHDTVAFNITGISTDPKRYTIVQRFIHNALINFTLASWWIMVGQAELSSVYFNMYNDQVKKVRNNAIRSERNKDLIVPSRYY